MNKIICTLVLAGTLLCGSCVKNVQEVSGSTDRAEKSASVLHIKNWPVVDVSVNGPNNKPFIIDTAAGSTIIDTEWATELSISDTGSGFVAGASGASVLSLGTAAAISVAGQTIEQLRVVLIDTDVFHPGVGGIIGNDIMSRYITTIDMPRGVFELADQDPSLELGSCVPNMMPQRLAATANFTFVPVLKNGRDGLSMTGIVDSGATQTVINWKAAEAIGINRDDPSLTLFAAGTKGLDKKAGQTTTYLKVIQGLRIGDWDIPEAEVRISDLPVFKAVGIADLPSVIIGSDILKQRGYTITKGSSHFCWREPVTSS